jgi:hypothetical protein
MERHKTLLLIENENLEALDFPRFSNYQADAPALFLRS